MTTSALRVFPELTVSSRRQEQKSHVRDDQTGHCRRRPQRNLPCKPPVNVLANVLENEAKICILDTN